LQRNPHVFGRVEGATKRFALAVIELTISLSWPSRAAALANQLLRSGTAIGAQYRAASKAKSRADFAYKIKLVEEEADESAYWLELLAESPLSPTPAVIKLLAEANELAALFSAISIKLRKDAGSDS